MAILEVLRFPDPRLRKKAKPVTEVTSELKKLADDMLETMYEQKGIGLAATQIGELVRLIILDVRLKGDDGRYEMAEMTDLEQAVEYPLQIFNPEIIKKEGDTTYSEGCLSVPGYFEEVHRSEYVELKGLDKEGNAIEIKTDGLLAICLQHEIDHLDGKLFIDRLSLLKSNRVKSKIKKYGYDNPNDEEESDSVTENEH